MPFFRVESGCTRGLGLRLNVIEAAGESSVLLRERENAGLVSEDAGTHKRMNVNWKRKWKEENLAASTCSYEEFFLPLFSHSSL